MKINQHAGEISFQRYSTFAAYYTRPPLGFPSPNSSALSRGLSLSRLRREKGGEREKENGFAFSPNLALPGSLLLPMLARAGPWAGLSLPLAQE